MRRVLVIALGCLLVLGTAAVGLAADKVFRFGVVNSVTGAGAAFGVMGNNATELAVEQINSSGGVNGVMLEPIYYDSQSNPTIAVNLTQRLLTRDRVPLVVGSTSSVDTLAMMELAERNRVPLFSPSAVAHDITNKGYQWIFRLTMSDIHYAVKLAEYIAANPAWQRVAILYENTDYGAPPARHLRENLGALGLNVTNFEAYNRGDPDFTALLTKVEREHPDIVVTWGYYTDLALIHRQMRSLGMNMTIMANSGAVMAEYLNLAGNASEGLLAITGWSATDPDPASQRFVAEYRERFGEFPDNAGAYSYDAIFVIAEAIRNLGDKEPTAANVREALSNMTWTGVTGDLAFNENGQSLGPVTIVTVRNGEFVFVEKTR